MIAVVDCNNFFASCEKVFRPDLKDKPVMVASNNDGCIVARSPEVKALGIPMGAPAFKWKETIALNKIQVFSGNFPLYGDLSRRVMSILHDACPDIEEYSIDEAFLNLTNYYHSDFEVFAKSLQRRILDWTGLPVSIGIGETKTLAKVAVEIAKKNEQFAGVVSTNNNDFMKYFKSFPVKDIWGVGRATASSLAALGIFTAERLQNLSLSVAKQRFGVVGQKTVLELNKIQCFSFSIRSEPRKGIVASRTFGTMVSDYDSLAESVALHISRAAERLRKDKSIARIVQVTLLTNRHRKDLKQYYTSASMSLMQPTSYTPSLIKAAHSILKKIYKPGYLYKKSMVYLTDITPNKQIQLNLMSDYHERPQLDKLMSEVDKFNKKFGRHKLKFAATGLSKKRWHPKKESLSRRYTTSWYDLPKAYAI